jgi:hypothetical protein
MSSELLGLFSFFSKYEQNVTVTLFIKKVPIVQMVCTNTTHEVTQITQNYRVQ